MRRLYRHYPADPATLAWLGAWVALGAGCVWAYWPGLAGPFVLDDFKSLAELGTFGGVDDWHSFKAYVLGGHAGPTGRPLSLLTFLIDGSNWPTDPWPFKRTNLVIHLLCGIVLGALMQRMLAVLGHDRATSRAAALAAAAIWLLHPFLVSTTLYAVQRMAQLSTLFVFLGLLGYLTGRAQLTTNRRRGYAWMSLTVVAATVLATLSKENGILLPLLVGVTECTIVSSAGARLGSLNRNWAAAFIVLPTAGVVAFLAWRASATGLFELAPGRDFSIYERLLTQFRVVADYLQHWFVPKLYTTGVFQDHVVKSAGLATPVTTLLGLLLHATLVTGAIVFRRRAPLAAFAVLFFYGSHVLESTVLNLELYFEHRNYLAAAFLALPLVVAARRALPRALYAMAALLLAVMLGAFTHYSATIWSDYREIVEASAGRAPTSVRAQQQLATMHFNDGEYPSSLEVLERALDARPDSAFLHLTRGIILCRIGVMEERDFAAIAAALSSQPYNGTHFEAHGEFAAAVIDSNCIDDSPRKLRSMFETMLTVPRNADPTSLAYLHINYFTGLASLRAGDMPAAIDAFDRSLRARGSAGPAMMMAAALASAGYYEQALRFSDRALDRLDHAGGLLDTELRVRRADVLEFQVKVRAASASRANEQTD